MKKLSPPIIFIVRASKKDGLGHLVRSIAVLLELRTLHPVRLLLLGDGSGYHLLESQNVEFVACASDYAAVDHAIALNSVVVVFDTLRFDQRAFDSLSRDVTTVSLSPVFTCMTSVDHLFHRTCKLDPSWSIESVFPEVHSGLEYTILPEWLKKVNTSIYREHLLEDKLGVAITMGGADASNRTSSLLKAFSCSKFRFVLFVALGNAFTHSYEELIELAKDNRQEVVLLKSNESMWRVLKTAVSIVICAGGLTTYEATFVGIPSINIINNCNWSYLFEELRESGVCHVLPPSESSIAKAVEIVESYASSDREQLASMHYATKDLIPKGGATKIAEKILSYL